MRPINLVHVVACT
ncbi:hypothetical protein F383_24816 [Gossypium arboreum]|nr:hypothetical protein F383_13362 [Gossypium arboreum]KHG19915.1 hypothetical protein F383_00491 [Gossypium arboreum]KHG20098.1 hypothetical protein F383_25546 [Gossypium arboreum]KHG20127.1 hypothetical protein F383_24283 [Gossypium arboreum]KHG20499.1 hypothetical protein F383_24816 [Gossypium arboreum]